MSKDRCDKKKYPKLSSIHSKVGRINESGGTLIGVIIAVFITSISIAAYMTSTSHTNLSRKMNISQQEFEDVIQSISNTIIQRFNSQIPNYCRPAPLNNIFRNVPFGDARLSFFNSGLTVPGAQTPTEISNALSRCEKNSAPPARNHYHFCLKVQADPSAPRRTFLGSKFAFIEVAVFPISTISNNALSCGAGGPGTGAVDSLKVFYKAFWGEPMGTENKRVKYMFWNRGGFFYADPDVT